MWKKLIFTQKCAMTLTLKDRSIKWSGVSNNIRPETTPALLNKRVTSPMRFLISSAILYTSSFFEISTTYPLQKPPIEVIILQVSSIAKKIKQRSYSLDGAHWDTRYAGNDSCDNVRQIFAMFYMANMIVSMSFSLYDIMILWYMIIFREKKYKHVNHY